MFSTMAGLAADSSLGRTVYWLLESVKSVREFLSDVRGILDWFGGKTED